MTFSHYSAEEILYSEQISNNDDFATATTPKNGDFFQRNAVVK